MTLSRIPQNFIDTYSTKVNELKMMEPLLFSDTTRFIDITTTTDPKYLSYIFWVEEFRSIKGIYWFMDSHSVNNR